MALWRSGRRNIAELNAWQKADEFSTLLHDMCRELPTEPGARAPEVEGNRSHARR